MSKARERANERRRYEEWQTKLAERKRRRRLVQRRALAAGSSLLAVAVIVGVTFLVTQGGDDDSTDTATASPTASATPVAGGCTPSTLPVIEKPEQYAKAPAKSLAANAAWTWTLKTTCGTIVVELDGKKAPQAVSAMVQLTRDKFFDKTPCPRVTDSGLFVLQCGDPTGTTSGGPGYSYGPIENPPADAVYKAGVVAMANSGTPDSNGSQFFLVYGDSTLPSQTGKAGGYTVIGKITKGLDVVEKVAKSGSDNSNSAGGGKPVTAVSIISATVKKG